MTFLAYDASSRRHDLPDHPETARRADAIVEALRRDPSTQRLPWISSDRPLARDEALRVHTPRLWLNLENAEAIAPCRLDPDTYVVAGSWEAARRTARLSLLAAERCWRSGEPGFVVARPPGHHATHDRSMGFCLLNNVALAARRLQDLGAKRVLIFDHDVHHGNGTQDVFYATDAVLYQSFHLRPHYPGTGAAEEVGSGDGNGFTVNAPLGPGDGEAEVRSLLLDAFLPIAKEYRPDAVLFSSGFDSLEGDPLGGLRLGPGFFGEMARRFLAVSPRLLCFLEGGYQLDRIPEAARAQVHALTGAPKEDPRDVRAPASLSEVRRLHGEHWSCLR